MKTKILVILISCFAIATMFSQVTLNQYKYVVVPKRYDFFKEADKYQLNSLSKFLFNKYGFETYMEGDDYPEDLIQNWCLALKADAFSKPTMFKTQIAIQLSDCNDKVVFSSDYGESRQKDFQKAFVEATREAFKHIEKLNHKFKPKDTQILKSATTKSDIEPIKKQNILYAQTIPGGFQVVDSTPQVIMVLIATPKEDLFIVKDKNATVFKEDGVWYYTENTKEKRELNIKF